MSDNSLDGLISVSKALEIIDAADIEPVEVVVPIEELDGHVLARDVLADRDYPPYEKSLVDGYACRAADLESLPATLTITDEVFAGTRPVLGIDAGEAISIMTGAPVPPGCDCVVPVEFTRVEANKVVVEQRPARPNLLKRAAEVCCGDLVMKAGTILGARQIAVLAQTGVADVPVFDLAAGAVLTTGDEIVDVTDEPLPWQIRDCNGPMLERLLRSLGCVVHATRHARDNPKRIREQIEIAFEDDIDLLLITGGMSMGKHDHTPAVLKQMGFAFHVTKLLVKPGKPFVFASRKRNDRTQFVFGLPGNPVSAYVCTLRLAGRLIDRLRGRPVSNELRKLPLLEHVEKNGPREFYLPAMVEPDGIRPLNWVGSADVFTLARADALIVRPINDESRKPGEWVDFIDLPRD